jgi:fructose-1,6-bisphosphatase
MPYRRTTLSKFLIETQRRAAKPEPELASLLSDVQTACKLIAVAASRGSLEASANPLDAVSNTIMVATCEWGGQLSGMVSKEMESPYPIPPKYPRGRFLLVFDPLDGASNIDVNAPVGTIFSVLRCPDGVEQPEAADFLQPGTSQVAAGYAIYGPVAMLVLTLGAGVHGFTLDRDIGAFILTHPDMTIPPATRESPSTCPPPVPGTGRCGAMWRNVSRARLGRAGWISTCAGPPPRLPRCIASCCAAACSCIRAPAGPLAN